MGALRTGEDWEAWLRATVAQWPGAPMVPPGTDGAVPPGLWHALVWLARRQGFAVGRARCDVGDSLTNWTSRRISICPDLDADAAAQALIHELAHVLVHETAGQPDGASTAGCRGVRKVEADSVAFAIATRLGLDTSRYTWPYVASWAGSDPRARPEAAIRTAAQHVETAAATIIDHLDIALFSRPPQRPGAIAAHATAASGGTDPGRVPRARPNSPAAGTGQATPDPPLAEIGRALHDAEQFFTGSLERGWAPRYLAERGLSSQVINRWRIGYAPATWTALTSHLRGLGHGDDVIEAAGLGRRSSRGNIIDYFRDRVMLAIRSEDGTIAGFIGRAPPGAEHAVPKYLNTPETAAYSKGGVLFGLHEACGQLGRGAVPVIVEGPFDAIAVTAADPRRYAGLAPCGTALTSRQAEALARVADVRDALVLLALDGDRAGRDAAIRAYGALSAITSKPVAVILPAGRDPAGILQADGAGALDAVLRHATEPLARVVIDAHLDRWAPQLRHAEGQLHAMRSAASLIASMLPAGAAGQILRITGQRRLETLDEYLRPVANPELTDIARLLPAGAVCQVVRVAERLAAECSDVTAEVANAVSAAAPPQGQPAHGPERDVGGQQVAQPAASPVPLTSAGFPASVRPGQATGRERPPPRSRSPASVTRQGRSCSSH